MRRGPFGRLAELGMLGMNRRNAEFLLVRNPRRLFPLVDDKLRTKELAERAGIAVPELYGVIEVHHQTRELREIIGDHDDFVIKPSQGSGGNGILVITGTGHGGYRGSDGTLVGQDELGYHVSNILSGMHSLGGTPDKAMIEYRVKFDPLFEKLSYQGVPDIRTIVYRGVPAACMVRLPTHHSAGKANLHQGAVGVGIDLATGVTRTGVWRNQLIDRHPDTGAELAGMRIPHWEDLMLLAARCYDLAGLGYLGIDIVLDKERGPLVLELNARPGLNIQLANGCGLIHVLRRLEAMEKIPEQAADRAALALKSG